MGEVNKADVRRERISLLWSTVGEVASVLVLVWGIRSIRVYAEERSCLDGVYTMRSSER